MDDLQFTSIYSFTIQQTEKGVIGNHFFGGGETVGTHLARHHVMSFGSHPSQALRLFRVFLRVFFWVLNFATDVPKGREFLQVHGCENRSILSSHIQVPLGSSKSGSSTGPSASPGPSNFSSIGLPLGTFRHPSTFQKVFEGFGVS